MTNQEILDSILLSTNATEEFYKAYENPDFKNWLLEILPEIERCKNQKQDNPWHIYGVLDHILHSVEEINKQTQDLDYNTRRMLAYTMFYHDISKPDCLIRRYSKLYKKEIDSFYYHNEESAKIARATLKNFNFTQNECDIIETLVDMHDIFINISLEPTQNKFKKVLSLDLINEHIERLSYSGNGVELFNYLLMIARADNLAQNPEMTTESLKLLDATKEILNNQLTNLN